MDIEKLTKSQIVLLTLLISFVTSIATGIVTVSLMEQAPPAITQTVNRIMERTIEKVVQAPEGQTAAVVERIVVREGDTVAKAIEVIMPSIVRIESSDGTFFALGAVIGGAGEVVSDAGAISSPEGLFAVFQGGSRVALTFGTTTHGMARLFLATTTEEGGSFSPSPATISPTPSNLGQGAVALSGEKSPRVIQGIVSAIDGHMVLTNIAGVVPGTPLVAFDGTLLGISTALSRAAGNETFTAFVPASGEKKEGGTETPSAE
jgi:hypothetical protein